MDDAALVGGFERVGDLAGDGERPSEGKRPAGEALRQGLPRRQLHDQEMDRRAVDLGLVQLVDAGDVRVVERRQHLGLALEPGEALGVGGERLGQHLDRHLAVEPGVGGPVHLAHAALAQLGGDREVGKGPADQTAIPAQTRTLANKSLPWRPASPKGVPSRVGPRLRDESRSGATSAGGGGESRCPDRLGLARAGVATLSQVGRRARRGE